MRGYRRRFAPTFSACSQAAEVGLGHRYGNRHLESRHHCPRSRHWRHPSEAKVSIRTRRRAHPISATGRTSSLLRTAAKLGYTLRLRRCLAERRRRAAIWNSSIARCPVMPNLKALVTALWTRYQIEPVTRFRSRTRRRYSSNSANRLGLDTEEPAGPRRFHRREANGLRLEKSRVKPGGSSHLTPLAFFRPT